MIVGAITQHHTFQLRFFVLLDDADFIKINVRNSFIVILNDCVLVWDQGDRTGNLIIRAFSVQKLRSKHVARLVVQINASTDLLALNCNLRICVINIGDF